MWPERETHTYFAKPLRIWGCHCRITRAPLIATEHCPTRPNASLGWCSDSLASSLPASILFPTHQVPVSRCVSLESCSSIQILQWPHFFLGVKAPPLWPYPLLFLFTAVWSQGPRPLFECARYAPSSGPLQWPFPPLGKLFPYVATRLTLILPTLVQSDLSMRLLCPPPSLETPKT